jgi:hypothetical protein
MNDELEATSDAVSLARIVLAISDGTTTYAALDKQQTDLLARTVIAQHERLRVSLELDDYETANLLWLIRLASRLGLDTGDWCHQIRSKLEIRGHGEVSGPNSSERDTEFRVSRINRVEHDRLQTALKDAFDAYCNDPALSVGPVSYQYGGVGWKIEDELLAAMADAVGRL